MACLNYEGGVKCRLHHISYELSAEIVDQLCTTENYGFCEEFIKSQKEGELEQSAQS